SVACWGRDASSQLGDGANDDTKRLPVDTGLRNAVSIAAGQVHACAVDQDGDVYCWGNGEFSGVLGLGGSITEVTVPTLLTDSDVSGQSLEVAVGYDYSCARLSSGHVACWGSDLNGAVGDGADDNAAHYRPVPVATGVVDNNVTALAGGNRHICALLSDGRVACWGRSSSGQTGTGETPALQEEPALVVGLPDADVTQLAAGAGHTCALLENGALYCWGRGFYGQLGQGSRESSSTPIQIVEADAENPVISVAAGYNQTCALWEDQTIQCWGYNFAGALGIDSDVDFSLEPLTLDSAPERTVAISAGRYFNCALSNRGNAQCWGKDNAGQLGTGNPPSGEQYAPVNVDLSDFDASILKIDSNSSTTCALLTSGEVICWGGGGLALGAGEDASGQESPVRVLGAVQQDYVVDLSVGSSFSCAVLQSGSVACWGADFFGTLGNGEFRISSQYESRLVEPGVISSNAVAVAAGQYHACALLNTGEVTCWGKASDGVLGIGETEEESLEEPSPVLSMPDNERVVALEAGADLTCALLESQDLACWGSDDDGQLGNGPDSSDSVLIPTRLAASDIGSEVSSIAMSLFSTTCATLVSGQVACWGSNLQGTLGDGSEADNESPVYVVDTPFISKAIGTSHGQRHSCAVDARGVVSCWGSNGDGQLGVGDESLSESFSPRLTPVEWD
ncbi:MAG: hypothetical protein MK135_16305, partial [Polyangiaceae bacterium]|nr:hypothetical protein [Polyangiaceae bacterium]